MSRVALPLLLVAVGCAEAPPPAAPMSTPDTADKVRRLGAILDYVAADYPGCVQRGAIVSPEEYEEQLVFLDDAAALATQLPAAAKDPRLAARLAALAVDVKQLAPAEQVSRDARTLGRDTLDAYGVVVAPNAAPDYDRGRAAFGEHCAKCHGDTGAGDGPRTREAPPLKVPPRSFLDPDVMADMSPVRAFNALTDGIEDAGMPKWDLLSPSLRWDLAFFVMTLRHDDEQVARGKTALAARAAPPSAALGALAAATDRQLLQILGTAETSPDELAYLRRNAPYSHRTASIDRARTLLAQAVERQRRGQSTRARELAAAAYLEGFEPSEAALRSVDPDLVVDLESHFLRFRQAIADGEDADTLEQRALRLGVLLDRAEDLLAGGTSWIVAFIAALAIVFREGLEAALLVLLLFGAARQAGGGRRERRAIHGGWLAAVAVGVVLWFAAEWAVGAVDGAHRELLEGGISLFAAAVLLAVSHFVLVRADAKRRVGALRDRLAHTLRGQRGALWLAFLGFIAVFREAFETVLFLHALSLPQTQSSTAVVSGAAAAVVALAAAVYALSRLGRRLNPGRVLSILGGLMCVLALTMAGKGIRALQEADAVGLTPCPGPRIDILGVFPSVETLAAQGLVAVAFVAIALAARPR